MPGLRIHHPEIRNATLMIHHKGDVAKRRAPKDYEIKVDAHGDALVSETVWRRLQEAYADTPHGFYVLNEVKSPPAQVVDTRLPALERRVFRQIGSEVVDLGILGGPPHGTQPARS